MARQSTAAGIRICFHSSAFILLPINEHPVQHTLSLCERVIGTKVLWKHPQTGE